MCHVISTGELDLTSAASGDAPFSAPAAEVSRRRAAAPPPLPPSSSSMLSLSMGPGTVPPLATSSSAAPLEARVGAVYRVVNPSGAKVRAGAELASAEVALLPCESECRALEVARNSHGTVRLRVGPVRRARGGRDGAEDDDDDEMDEDDDSHDDDDDFPDGWVSCKRHIFEVRYYSSLAYLYTHIFSPLNPKDASATYPRCDTIHCRFVTMTQNAISSPLDH